MKIYKIVIPLFSLTLILACESPNEDYAIHKVNWADKIATSLAYDSLISGSTYLSIYSQIYSRTDNKTIDLTAVVSIRNTNQTDTIYLAKAEYFATKGHSIRSYFNEPIFILPMETIEIIIGETDDSGGTGANFVFDWFIKPTSNEPFFEGVMISASGQLGLAFTTHGKRIE